MHAGLRWALGMMMLLLAAQAAATVQEVSHGRFQQVPVYAPDGPVQRVVLWFQRGHHAAASVEVEALRRDGALVAAVDVGGVERALQREGSDLCGFGAGDVENFSRWLQAYLQLPGYRLPLLGGDGEGAGLAYALAAQAEPTVLAGLLTSGFCPRPSTAVATCGAGGSAHGLKPAVLHQPWLDAAPAPGAACATDADAFVSQIALARRFKRSDSGSAVPGLIAAARVMGAARGVLLAPAPDALQGLPVVEVPASGAGDTLAIFVSGDGGWAGLDKDVAAALAAQGVAVVGVDSLRYFWKARTPAGFAADLTRIVDHYRTQWQRPRLLLIGFSQGADVLPASINQLDPALRAQVQRIVLLSPGRKAEFEFHVSNWLGSSDRGLPIEPEVARLPADRTWCVHGQADADAMCPDLPASSGVHVVTLPGDHHFDGDHDRLAALILQGLGEKATPQPTPAR